MIWQLTISGLYPFNSYQSSFNFYLASITIPLVFITLLLFSRSILNTKNIFPKYDQILKGLIYILLLLSVTAIFYFSESIKAVGLLLNFLYPFLLFVAVKSYLSGNKPALFFIIAQIPYLISAIMLKVLLYEGYIDYSVVSRHGVVIGIFLEVILFSLALAYRIRLLQQ